MKYHKKLLLFLFSLSLIQTNQAQAAMNGLHMAQGVAAGCLFAYTASIIEQNLRELFELVIFPNLTLNARGFEYGYWIGVGATACKIIPTPSLLNMIKNRARNRIQRNQRKLQEQIQQNLLQQPLPHTAPAA